VSIDVLSECLDDLRAVREPRAPRHSRAIPAVLLFLHTGEITGKPNARADSASKSVWFFNSRALMSELPKFIVPTW